MERRHHKHIRQAECAQTAAAPQQSVEPVAGEELGVTANGRPPPPLRTPNRAAAVRQPSAPLVRYRSVSCAARVGWRMNASITRAHDQRVASGRLTLAADTC